MDRPGCALSGLRRGPGAARGSDAVPRRLDTGEAGFSRPAAHEGLLSPVRRRTQRRDSIVAQRAGAHGPQQDAGPGRGAGRRARHPGRRWRCRDVRCAFRLSMQPFCSVAFCMGLIPARGARLTLYCVGNPSSGPQVRNNHRRSAGGSAKKKAYSEFDPRHALHARDVWKVWVFSWQAIMCPGEWKITIACVGRAGRIIFEAGQRQNRRNEKRYVDMSISDKAKTRR